MYAERHRMPTLLRYQSAESHQESIEAKSSGGHFVVSHLPLSLFLLFLFLGLSCRPEDTESKALLFYTLQITARELYGILDTLSPHSRW